MSERMQIVFMQTRIARLASEKWNLPIAKIGAIFKKYDVFGYIEKGFGIFHCEGDEAVFYDVSDYLTRKGFRDYDKA